MFWKSVYFRLTFTVPYSPENRNQETRLLNNILLTFKKVQMKTIRTASLCALFALSALVSSGQDQKIPINEPDYNKPRLFNSLPDQIPVTSTLLDNLISSPVGRNSRISLAADETVPFQGEVVSVASKYNNTMQSVVIRSDSYEGASLTVTRVTAADGTVKYTGRIISFKHGDLFVLETRDGQLMLVKKNYYEVVNE